MRLLDTKGRTKLTYTRFYTIFLKQLTQQADPLDIDFKIIAIERIRSRPLDAIK